MGTLTVTAVAKAYKRSPGKWARLREWMTGKPCHEKTWVLRDVTFHVDAGESVGILGVNGAGKNTLLKIIAGTTQPTAGSVTVEGRVAALLELGMGFQPDFTGRQNAHMAGQLLGYSADEVRAAMPAVEEFADIGAYIDRPVRVYSSGMQVRLAFAAATAHRPDLLIVDEALAVGDAAFQRKCFRRIETLQSAGTALLFVSHDVETVKKLCDRALLLENGHAVLVGPAKPVCDEYERRLFGDRGGPVEDPRAATATPAGPGRFDPALAASSEMRYGNGKAEIESCWLADGDGRRSNVIEAGTPFLWCYRVRFNADVDEPVFAMMLKTREGVAVYGTDSTALRMPNRRRRAGEELEVRFSLAGPLAPGLYFLICGVREHRADKVEFLSRRVDSAILRVTAGPSSTAATGIVELGAAMQLLEPRIASVVKHV